MKTPRITIHPNATIFRDENRRISIVNSGDGFSIRLTSAQDRASKKGKEITKVAAERMGVTDLLFNISKDGAQKLAEIIFLQITNAHEPLL